MAKVPRDRAFAMAVLFTGHGPTTFAGRQHDLHGAELPGLALDNAKMPNVILSRANLSAAKLARRGDGKSQSPSYMPHQRNTGRRQPTRRLPD